MPGGPGRLTEDPVKCGRDRRLFRIPDRSGMTTVPAHFP